MQYGCCGASFLENFGEFVLVRVLSNVDQEKVLSLGVLEQLRCVLLLWEIDVEQSR